MIKTKQGFVILLTFLYFFFPSVVLSQGYNKDNMRKLVEYEEGLPYINTLSGVACKIGREANSQYLPFFTKDFLKTLGEVIDTSQKKLQLPLYGAVTNKDKASLQSVRVALILKKLREICPDVW